MATELEGGGGVGIIGRATKTNFFAASPTLTTIFLL